MCELCGTIFILGFLDQPPMGYISSPVATPVSLSCSVNEGFIQTWSIDLPGSNEPVFSHDTLVGVPALNSYGIQVESSSFRMSQLVFSATIQVQVTVRCAAINHSFPESPTSGNQVTVIIYGITVAFLRLRLTT